MNCSSDTETEDFLTQWFPDTGSKNLSSLPSFELMQYDPATAYMMITGIDDENATSEMCLKAYSEAYAKLQSRGPRYKLVESDYVKALTKGYIIEIQEGSRIKDSGVLVGIGKYEKPNSVIRLADGSYKRRHKDAISIYTDNVDYVSCRPVDQSVIRRMSFIIDSDELPKNVLIDRVKRNTGYDNNSVIEACYKLWNDVKTYALEHDITDGSISATELEMFIQCLKHEGTDTGVRDTAIQCIISKATSDKEEQSDLIANMDVKASSYGLW